MGRRTDGLAENQTGAATQCDADPRPSVFLALRIAALRTQ